MRVSNRKKVLITGGLGFLGSHLCERLLMKNCDVLCADNFYSGTRDNVEHLLGNPHFELMRHDVTFPLYVEIDEIYNLACPASPIHYQWDPVQTTKTSVHGAINMLGLGQTHKSQDSSGFYQRGSTATPKSIRSRKATGDGSTPSVFAPVTTKASVAQKRSFFDYHRQHNLEIKVVRIFNTYGPRMHPNDGRVVSNFIVQALRSEDITIYGDGSQTRSFCYADDLIDGFVLMMASPREVTGPINMGNPDEFTIKQLAETVLKMVGGKSKLVFKPLPQDDPKQRQPDISVARETLGWVPQVKLEEGLEKTVDYFRRFLGL